MALEKWSTTAGNNVNANTGINWDEGMAPSAVNDSARSQMADVRDWYENAEWPIYGRNGSANAYSISFVSTTVFKFAGTDRRTLIPIGRRVKAGVGAGTIYGTCTDVTLSASDTQATMVWDSGQLDSSLSYVALGVMSPTNNSHPRNMNMSFSDIAIAGSITSPIRGNPDASLSDVVFTGTLTGTGVITLGTEVASTSGTTITFSGIPTWAKRITMILVGVSTNGTNNYLVQLGDAGGPENSGYLGGVVTSSSDTAFTAAFGILSGNASNALYGQIVFTLEDATDFTWSAVGMFWNTTSSGGQFTCGTKATSAALDRVSITTVGGTDTFDAGVINISYE